jgi:hypothetical protein
LVATTTSVQILAEIDAFSVAEGEFVVIADATSFLARRIGGASVIALSTMLVGGAQIETTSDGILKGEGAEGFFGLCTGAASASAGLLGVTSGIAASAMIGGGTEIDTIVSASCFIGGASCGVGGTASILTGSCGAFTPTCAAVR